MINLLFGPICLADIFGAALAPEDSHSICWLRLSLRKHTYSNILKIAPPKNENFQIKKSDVFHISAQNIDCGSSLEPPRRGGSNEYPQSKFLSRNKKNNVYFCKPQFYFTFMFP